MPLSSPARERRVPVPEVLTVTDSDTASTTSTASSTITPQQPPQQPLWTESTVADLIQSDRLVTYDGNDNVEKAFELMGKRQLTCLPLTKAGSTDVVAYLDYSDLNCYLLLVMGHVDPAIDSPQFREQVETARRGVPAKAIFASQLGAREPFVRMAATVPLSAAIRQFAAGVHRIAAVNERDQVVGVLSQRRMVRYVWNNLRRFPLLDPSLDKPIEDLQVGTYNGMMTITGDALLIDALALMHDSTVSSVAIVDREGNLLGNISVTDVQLLTSGQQSHLLRMPCRHFLTVILENRGLIDGKDSVPVFYVHRSTKLSKVMAKLVATKAHRLWIVDRPVDPVTSGKLVGVISLTDILNFVARQGGQQMDPEAARRHRRSSSSSVRSNSRARSSMSIGSPQSPHQSPSGLHVPPPSFQPGSPLAQPVSLAPPGATPPRNTPPR